VSRIPVSSSNIESIGYSPSTTTLEVEFKTRRVYRYDNVPRSIYESFLKAVSKGTFFDSHIRGQYRFRKIS